MKHVYYTTLKQIPDLAKELAEQLKGGEILALIGPLGSGKTTFSKALAKEFKVKDTVSSPTFVIMNQYRGSLNRKTLHFYHLDLYRTKDLREVKALGLMEIWGQPSTLTLIEWADKIKKTLPKNTITIKFK